MLAPALVAAVQDKTPAEEIAEPGLVGPGGVGLPEFLRSDPASWF